MKKETIEKILMAIIVIAIIVLAKMLVNKEVHRNEMKKAHIDSLEVIASKVDSLENIVSMYDIPDSCWEVEIDTNGKGFTDYFENNFAEHKMDKVVIIATSDMGDNLHWHIKVKNQ